MTSGKVLPSLNFNFTILKCRGAANQRQTDFFFKHLPTFSITEFSPRKRQEANDIITSFGVNCYRLRYVGNGTRGMTDEVLFLSPSPEMQLQLANESLPTYYPPGDMLGGRLVTNPGTALEQQDMMK